MAAHAEGDEACAQVLRSALTAQYHAVLAMLRQAIELCPDDLWDAPGKGVPYWRVAYHALYYTHLYLGADDTSFTPWDGHQTGLQDLDDVPAPPELQELLEPPRRWPRTGRPLTRDEVLEYWAVCDGMVDRGVGSLDLLAPVTGFRWHDPQRSKVKHQIDTIRHIQHHASQLAARLHEATGRSVDWVGSKGDS